MTQEYRRPESYKDPKFCEFCKYKRDSYGNFGVKQNIYFCTVNGYDPDDHLYRVNANISPKGTCDEWEQDRTHYAN